MITFYLWKMVRVLRPSNNIPNTTRRIFTYMYIQGYDDISHAYTVRLIRTAVNPRGGHSLELPAPACVGSKIIQKSKTQIERTVFHSSHSQHVPCHHTRRCIRPDKKEHEFMSCSVNGQNLRAEVRTAGGMMHTKCTPVFPGTLTPSIIAAA
jgi:hypothetical protein